MMLLVSRYILREKVIFIYSKTTIPDYLINISFRLFLKNKIYNFFKRTYDNPSRFTIYER